MKKIVSAFLLVVVLGMAVQSNTAQATADQVPKVLNTVSYTIEK